MDEERLRKTFVKVDEDTDTEEITDRLMDSLFPKQVSGGELASSEGARGETSASDKPDEEADVRSPEQRLEDDGINVCPFCGGTDEERCEHQLANFPWDAEDSGGGVLAPGWGWDVEESAVYRPAGEFALACSELLEAVWRGDDQELIDRRQLELRRLSQEMESSWREVLIEAIAEDYIPDDHWREELATRAVSEMVKGVPGVLVGRGELGGMTSVYAIYLWSEEPAAATEALSVRIGGATESVRRLTEAIVRVR